MSKDMSIFVATHKKFDMFKTDIYEPIQVGCALNSTRFGYLVDNIEDNISSKNRNYCELTALYWIWKNNNSKIKGLCHYRRYLSLKDINTSSKFFINKEVIENDLRNYDLIIPKKRVLKRITCRENYLLGQGIEKDLDNLQKIIKKVCPEYEESYEKILNGNICSYCNVMIAKAEVFDSYCKWLFEILFELEKITDLTGYTYQEARVYGYLSELLLNVWIDKNNLKYKEYSLINTEIKKDAKYYVKFCLEKFNMYKFIREKKDSLYR
ncbi:MAG: DUF4422 domain-containing protein [Clostridium sp.]|nr:DUF4422 domain-containing protein [Clostridium sp.]